MGSYVAFGHGTPSALSILTMNDEESFEVVTKVEPAPTMAELYDEYLRQKQQAESMGIAMSERPTRPIRPSIR